jgi:hypothetical protein
LDSDQPKLDFNCRYFTSKVAISAVQSWVFSALAEVPTKVFTRRKSGGGYPKSGERFVTCGADRCSIH